MGARPYAATAAQPATDALIEHIAERGPDVVEESSGCDAPDCASAAVTFHTFHNGSKNGIKAIRFCPNSGQYE
jgi:hypothetical protein